MDALNAWYTAPEYQPLIKLRKGCTSELDMLMMLEGATWDAGVQFLTQRLGERKGTLLLKLWAAGEGRPGDHARAIWAIYRD